MSALLNKVIEAHGGLEPWRKATTIEADVTYGGPFWEFKGVADFLGTDHVAADIHREHITLTQPSGRVIEFDKQADRSADRTADRSWMPISLEISGVTLH